MVVIISFLGITAFWSAYRFRLMLENLKVPDRVNPDEAFDFYQALVVQRISAIKSNSDFTVAAFKAPGVDNAELFDFLKARQRVDVDDLIRVNDWIGVIVEGEDEGLTTAFARWQEELGSPLLAGAVHYPEFANTSKKLIDGAEAALETVSEELGGLAWGEPESEDDDEEDDAEDKAADDSDEDDDASHDSSLDALTGVLAPHKVAAYMRKFIGEYRRKHELALFFIGINEMKDVEDLHGPEAADAARKAVSEMIQGALREDDVIGRYDEDEFLALIICDSQFVEEIGKRVRDRSQRMVIRYNNRRIKVTVNVGISICPRHGRNLPALFNAAKGAHDLARSRQGSMSLLAGDK